MVSWRKNNALSECHAKSDSTLTADESCFKCFKEEEKYLIPQRPSLNPYSLISENSPSLSKSPNITLQSGSSNGGHFPIFSHIIPSLKKGSGKLGLPHQGPSLSRWGPACLRREWGRPSLEPWAWTWWLMTTWGTPERSSVGIFPVISGRDLHACHCVEGRPVPHCVTLKERKFPKEKKNKANCLGGKQDLFPASENCSS